MIQTRPSKATANPFLRVPEEAETAIPMDTSADRGSRKRNKRQAEEEDQGSKKIVMGGKVVVVKKAEQKRQGEEAGEVVIQKTREAWPKTEARYDDTLQKKEAGRAKKKVGESVEKEGETPEGKKMKESKALVEMILDDAGRDRGIEAWKSSFQKAPFATCPNLRRFGWNSATQMKEGCRQA